MKWFKKKEEERAEQPSLIEDPLLSLLQQNKKVTRTQAMESPAFAACVKFISAKVASTPICLYREKNKKVEPVEEDARLRLFNDDTGDILTGYQIKEALVEDFLIDGAGYAYINWEGNQVNSLHYVERNRISFLVGTDPIFKECRLEVGGRQYREFEFLKVTRSTRDGVRGIGILEENNLLLHTAYNTLRFENGLVQTGGNRRGFLKSEKRMDAQAVREVKESWKRLYSNTEENVVVLNNGLEFQEASNTSVEMQLNQNKTTNRNDIYSLFGLSPSILAGKATNEEYTLAMQTAVIPVLEAIAAAANKDLLLESEKESFYFAFDTKELLKGDMEKRYRSYEIACRNGFMQPDEIRYQENLSPLDLGFIKLGLQDVLYDPKTKQIYTPNTDKTGAIGMTAKGGDTNDESGDSNRQRDD